MNNSFSKLFKLIQLNKKEIESIYLFSSLNGLVQLSLPLGVQAIIGLVMGATMVTSLYVLIFLVVMGVIIVGILQVQQMKIVERIQQRIFTNYAMEIADRIPKFDLKKLDTVFLPEKANRFLETVNIQKGFTKLLLDIPIASIQIVLGLILLSLYNSLFIFLGILLLIVVGVILRQSSPKGIATSYEESNFKYAVLAWFVEISRTIKSFKFSEGSNYSLQKTDQLVIGYLKARTSHFKVLLFQYQVLIFIKVIITTAMLSIGTYLLINQTLNVGEFIAAEIIILMVIGAVEKLIYNLDSVYDVITGLEKIESLKDNELEKSGSMVINQQNTGFKIEFKAFTFGYIKNKPIIDSLDLRIEKNQIVGIYGNDGSGKSMLLRLLSGNYTEFDGNLLLNDLPISNYEIESLRNNIGVMNQGQEIFGGTLLENINLGHQTYHPESIIQLANQIGIVDFIDHFPQGFDTYIEPIGKKIPGKITQKILLLRALIGQKSLLLLDEPWQGLITEDQIKVKNYLLKQKNQTILVVTNDPTFISSCDIKIRFVKGKMV